MSTRSLSSPRATARNRTKTASRHPLRNAALVTVILIASPILGACSRSSVAAITPPGASTPTLKQNRLIHETSPYLLEHSHDPVDWYPWGDEAFKKAKRENKPILLSIGYSACHWCHVMQRESFQDRDTAGIMNENFVNIKVDREERPDVDEVYMRAVQAITGRGGWPATVFLTPDLKPFYAGTYFPNKDMLGMPSFKKILTAVKQAWNQDPIKQDKIGSEVARIISAVDLPGESTVTIDDDTITAALETLLKNYDTTYGGIGVSPKFPLPGPISLCMRAVASGAAHNQRQLCMPFITTTLDKMAYGGIHDHIGGGFYRYSTDRKWHVPHFEKMLYDNALISGNYLDGYLITGKAYWAQTARDTLDFCLADLRSPDGAFFSSLDADSQGEEGAFYTFTQQQLIDALGAQDAHWFAQSFGTTPDGNFHARQNVLYFTDSPEALARRNGLSQTQYLDRVASLKQKLLVQRNKRPRPQRDEKAIPAWNALMISSLVKGYRVLGDEKYLDAAKQSARFLLSKMYFGDRLHRTWAAGRAGGEAYLDDYAFTVQALLDLAGADFDPTWLKNAKTLNRLVLEHYSNQNNSDFFYTADYQDQLLSRITSSHDSILPSGTGVEILNLIRLAQITADDHYKVRAEKLLKLYNEAMRKDPIAYGSMLNALDYFLHSKTEIVLVAPIRQLKMDDWRTALFSTYAPNTNTLFFKPSGSAATDDLLRNKLPIAGRPTVYLCHDMVCEKPIADAAYLRQKLNKLAAEHVL